MAVRPVRVLVVDDNIGWADATVMLIQLWGYRAGAAYSAEKCIAIAKAFAPDVVLLAIGLPDRGRFDVNRGLQRLIPRVTVFATTGFTRSHIIREEGFADYLLKPVESALLRSIIDQCTTAKAAP
jgi:CheY-like chemotaxis protein